MSVLLFLCDNHVPRAVAAAAWPASGDYEIAFFLLCATAILCDDESAQILYFLSWRRH